MTLEQKVINANDLDLLIETLEKQKEELEELIKVEKEKRDLIFSELLAEAKAANIKDEKLGKYFLTYFSKEDITWLDDAGLLKKLQENNATDFIKVTTKVTTSVDKNALKKAFKANESLKEEYKDYYGSKLIEYVTVTTEENHTKMLEHIEEGKK